jgi:hypothetical protein
MQIVFFKRAKPRQYDYKPLHWDEEKERQEQRRKRLQEGGTTGGEGIRTEIDRRWRRIDRTNRNKAKGINLLVFLVIAALLAYFVFFA